MAEFAPELGVLLLVVLGQVVQQAQHLAGAALADGFDVLRFLQDFARDVERQVGGIDHAAHEAHVLRHQLFGVVHDEHAAHVELDAVARLAVVHVERRAARDVQQLRVFLLAFDARVRPRQRVVEIVADVLVEFLVLLFGDLVLGARPQRGSLVDGLVFVQGFVLAVLPLFLLHQDGLHDVVGIFAG